MYINTTFLKQKDVKILDIVLLQLIKQNTLEDMSEVLENILTENDIKYFTEEEYVHFLKETKTNDTVFKRIRTTPKATNLIELANTPSIEIHDEKMANYLIKMYMNNTTDTDRSIGNKKKVTQYVAEFRKMMGLTPHQMYYLCELFIRETKYTKVLERIFFDSNKHRYAKFINHIEDSKLYQFFDENKEQVELYWKNRIK